MPDSDKYPAESGRRRFVKGVVGSAALASVGTGAAAALGTATSSSGAGGGITKYIGIENVDGPAPRGMPQIPVEITDEGELQGRWPKVEEVQEEGKTVKVAETKIAGYTYSSEWFQYCGVQSYPGVAPDADQNNTFLASGSAPYEWQSDVEEGEPLTVDMFDDYESWQNEIGRGGLGKPASATWRSEDVEPQATIPVQIIRSPKIQQLANSDHDLSGWVSATCPQGFIAWLNKCTHFCCVPGFKALEGSAAFGAEDQVYCQCHQSVYDPFNPISKSFVALPRPEGDDE